jgi:hypothetical protein
MYFCPKCNYSFDITKSSGEDLRKELLTPEDVIKRIRADKDLTNYFVKFDRNELIKNKKFKKLSKEQQDSIDLLYQSYSFDGIEFKCLNCNFSKPINYSIKLYEIDLNDDNVSTYKSVEDNKLIVANPILPRTKDYNCKNMNCITHKDNSKKEAVFYKDKRTHNLIYVCGVCYTSWG